MTPDEYINHGPMKPIVALSLLLLSFVLALFQFLGNIHIGYAVTAIPAAYVVIRRSIFTLLVNSFHYALQVDSVDQERNQNHLVDEKLKSAVTLDTDMFLRSIREDDDKVGRA